MLDEDAIARRLPVWIAFADLFLDDETQDYTYRFIARTCRESGYSRPELLAILGEEVAPVFGDNLTLVAGQWGAWPDLLVEEMMRKQLARPKRLSWPYRGTIECYTKSEWDKIEFILNRPEEP